MRIFFLFFLSLVSFALPIRLTAQPPKEGVELLLRLIRLIRKDSRISSDVEYKQLESILKMTKGERERLFRSAATIENWRSHFKASMTKSGEWKNIENNTFLERHFFEYAYYIEWVQGSEATASRFKIIRHPDGNQYAFLFEPSPHLSVDHLPTHLQIREMRGIGETSAQIVYFQSKDGFKGVVDSFFLLASEHRFVTLSFIRKNSPSIINMKDTLVPEKTLFSNAIVDLASGRVYSGWNGKRGWLKAMQGPMTDLFREEFERLESPLSKLLRTALQDLRSQGWHDIDAFLEKELTLIGDGIFRYRLARYNFVAESFESHSPIITFIIDMKNLLRPRVIQMNLKP